MRKLLLVMAIFLVFGAANVLAVDTQWDPPYPDPNLPVGEAFWNVALNWNTGNIPTSADKTQFGGVEEAKCVIASDAQSGQTVIGDGGTDPMKQVTVKDGATWETFGPTTWSAAGYNRQGTLNVERGGTVITEHRFGVGLVNNASTTPLVASELNLTGGYMDITGNLQIGASASPTVGHLGIVTVDSGTLVATGWEWRDFTATVPTPATWSFMDISHGTVIIGGDQTGAEPDDVPQLFASGNLTAFGGASTINASFADGETTITAVDPLARSPKMDEIVPAGAVNLSWNAGGALVDVYFDGVLQGSTTDSSFAVGGVAAGPHTWQVDDGTTLGDTVIYFQATNDQPPTIAMVTGATATWIGQSTALEATVTDDGVSAVSVVWTSDADPNAVISGEALVDNGDGTLTATANVTCDAVLDFTVTATVSDVTNPDADDASVAIECAEDACQAARGPMGLAAENPGDIDGDCDVDLDDLAVITASWLTDYTILAPEPDNR